MYLAPRGDTESASVIEAAVLTGTITSHSQSTAQRHPLPGWNLFSSLRTILSVGVSLLALLHVTWSHPKSV